MLYTAHSDTRDAAVDTVSATSGSLPDLRSRSAHRGTTAAHALKTGFHCNLRIHCTVGISPLSTLIVIVVSNSIDYIVQLN